MSHNAIIKNIQSGKFAPIYTLCGDEPYFIDLIESELLKHAISEEEKDFNLNIMYGKETEISQVIDAAKRYPMMAERQVVVLREAQSIKNFKELEQYAKNPVGSTVLIILYKHGKPNGRLAVTKALKKAPNVYFESKKLYENQVPAWIKKHLLDLGYKIGDKETYLLAEYLGVNLAKIVNELDKLVLNINSGVITAVDIEENIGISKDYNVFELQDAIINKDEVKILRIVDYYSSDIKNHHPIGVIAALFSYFSKLLVIKGMRGKNKTELQKATKIFSDYILRKHISAASKLSLSELILMIETLHEFDLKIKGLGSRNTPMEQLLQEMLFRLIRVTPINYDVLHSE